jgi:methyl-accepting chemotaxis protein
MSTDESLARAEQLLARLEATRAELEQLSQANDAERALDVLTELADLSRQVEEELQRAKRQAEEGDAKP